MGLMPFGGCWLAAFTWVLSTGMVSELNPNKISLKMLNEIQGSQF